MITSIPITVFLFFPVTILYLLGFVIALKKNDNSIADIIWGLGFLVISWTSFVISSSPLTIQSLLLLIMVTLWSLRLSLHIFTRNKGKSEDYRYKQWRQSWGKWVVIRSFFQVFVLQMGLLLIISSPIWVSFLIHSTEQKTSSMSLLTIIGFFIWATGFTIETVADIQLRTFITQKNTGKTSSRFLSSGLWKFSRHPNYFGESVLWWGIYLVAIDLTGLDHTWWTVIGPITITFLVRFVSGVPLLEKKYQGNAEWEQYAAKTSIFFPLPPKK